VTSPDPYAYDLAQFQTNSSPRHPKKVRGNGENMRRYTLVLGLGLLLASCGTVPSNSQTTTTTEATPALDKNFAPVEDNSAAALPDIIAGEAIVKLKEGMSLQSLSSEIAGLSLASVRTLSGGEHLVKISSSSVASQSVFTAQATMDAVSVLSHSSLVEYAQANYRLQPRAIPNDPSYGVQWDLPKMNMSAAWDVTTGSSSVVVAVIDTGIASQHPDLLGRTVAGYDFVSDVAAANDGNGRDSNPEDPGDAADCQDGTGFHPSSFHGSHVSGTIGAKTNNSIGIAGINWVSKIQPVRVLGKCGGSTADIVDAIRWAGGVSVAGVPTNATPSKIINMSLGGYLGRGNTCASADTATLNAIRDVNARGVSVIVAAGNDNRNAQYDTPASCSGTITVAATNRSNKRAYYSNYGSVVDIAAPGGDTRTTDADGILSTLKNDAGQYIYGAYQGTSMATPHVVGVVSLMYSLKSNITPAQVISVLQSTVTAFPSSSGCTGTTSCGAGIVNAKAALDKVKTL
jgi:serine protease